MPTFKVRGPDGTVVPINASDSQTAIQMAQQQYATRGQSQGGGLFGDKVAPGGFSGMVANAIGAKDPAYQRAYAREQQADTGPLGPRPRDIASQVTAPFMPYVQGGLGYASQGLANLSRSASGQPIDISAATAGQAAEDYERNSQAAWAKAHPAQAVAGNVAGMAVLGPARAGTVIGGVPYQPATRAATTLTQKALNVARNVGTGTGLGATYGAAEAPSGQHLQGAVTGGLMGGLTAGALAGVGAVAPKVAKPVAGLFSNRLGAPVVGASVPKAPARQAASYVVNKLGQAGIGLPQLASATSPTAAEAAGNTGRVALAALGRQGGKTPELLSDMVAERRAGRPDRILDAVSRATGIDPAGARGSVESIISNGQAKANPLFDAVRATPGPVWSADLAKISERPAMKSALKATAEAMQNAGKDPYQVGLAIDPDTGSFKVGTDLKGVTEPQPMAEAWENVRQMLGDLGKETPNMSNTQRIQAKGFQAAQRDLTSTLAGDETGQGALIPGYRDALNVAGDYKSVQGAYNGAKGKLFSQKFTPADWSDMQDGATQGDLNGIRHAAASDLYDIAQNGLLTPNRVKSPAFKAKLTLAFGPNAADQITGTMADEAQQAQAENQLYPQAGSQTAPLSAAIKEQQENPLGDFAADAISHTISAGGNPVHGVGMAAVKNAGKLLTSAMKTPGMGTDARDEAGRLLMMSPNDLHDYLNSNNFAPNALARPPLTPFLSGRFGGDISGMIMSQPGNDQNADDPSLVAAQ